MLGYTLQELKKKRASTLMDAKSSAIVKQLHKRERTLGMTSSYEVTMITKSGERFSVHITGTPLRDGATMGIITDLRGKKRQETIYRQLIEHMQEGVWMGDANAKTVYANPRFCEMMEYSSREIIGMSEYDFWDDAYLEKIKRINNGERLKGKSSSYEAVLKTKSDKRIPVFVNGSPLPGGGTMAITTDLRPIKEKESVYRTLVENMNEIVWKVDKKGNTVYVNPKFEEILEYSEEEIVGKPAYRMIHPDHVKHIQRIDREERKKGISSSYETMFVTKSGKEIPVLTSGTPLPDGGSMGIFTDLTALKEKQRKEQVLTQAIAYATDGIIIVDSEGHVQAWNKGAKIIFGYEEHEVMGRTVSHLFTTEDVQLMMHQSTVRYNFELQATHKSKQKITVSATLTPVFDAGKKMSSVLLITRDITGQRKFEEELSIKYQKLRDAYSECGIMRRQIDYIFELCQVNEKYGDLGSIADFVTNSIIMLSRVDGCVLRILSPEKQTLELLSSFGVDESWQGKASIPFAGSLAEQAWNQGTPIKIVDITKELRHASIRLARMHNFSSLLVIPLRHQGRFIGSLTLYVTPEKKLEIFENDFIEQYALLVGLILALRMQSDGKHTKH